MKGAQGFSLLEKQILALHFNGTYLSNFDFKRIAEQIGLDIDLADREKMLKVLLKKAAEEGKNAELVAAFTQMLSNRIQAYRALMERYPEAKEVIMPYIQKTRSTIMLLQQRLSANPYE